MFWAGYWIEFRLDCITLYTVFKLNTVGGRNSAICRMSNKETATLRESVRLATVKVTVFNKNICRAHTLILFMSTALI